MIRDDSYRQLIRRKVASSLYEKFHIELGSTYMLIYKHTKHRKGHWPYAVLHYKYGQDKKRAYSKGHDLEKRTSCTENSSIPNGRELTRSFTLLVFWPSSRKLIPGAAKSCKDHEKIL